MKLLLYNLVLIETLELYIRHATSQNIDSGLRRSQASPRDFSFTARRLSMAHATDVVIIVITTSDAIIIRYLTVIRYYIKYGIKYFMIINLLMMKIANGQNRKFIVGHR